MKLFRKKKKAVHLLHIGKTGGTSLISTFKDLSTSKFNFITHPHQFKFKDIPKGEKAVFFLRNPADRFVSGFYSRKRKGQPTYDVPWNAEEEIAFNAFDTPDSLASALSSTDSNLKETAVKAMQGIRHVNTYFSDWLVGIDYLEKRKKDIFYIGFQETFDGDLRRLYKKLTRLDWNTSVAEEHINRTSVDKNLSDESIKNLARWYKNDIALYQYCKTVSVEINS